MTHPDRAGIDAADWIAAIAPGLTIGATGSSAALPWETMMSVVAGSETIPNPVREAGENTHRHRFLGARRARKADMRLRANLECQLAFNRLDGFASKAAPSMRNSLV
jgi:hypothetical protein